MKIKERIIKSRDEEGHTYYAVERFQTETTLFIILLCIPLLGWLGLLITDWKGNPFKKAWRFYSILSCKEEADYYKEKGKFWEGKQEVYWEDLKDSK